MKPRPSKLRGIAPKVIHSDMKVKSGVEIQVSGKFNVNASTLAEAQTMKSVYSTTNRTIIVCFDRNKTSSANIFLSRINLDNGNLYFIIPDESYRTTRRSNEQLSFKEDSTSSKARTRMSIRSIWDSTLPVAIMCITLFSALALPVIASMFPRIHKFTLWADKAIPILCFAYILLGIVEVVYHKFKVNMLEHNPKSKCIF